MKKWLMDKQYLKLSVYVFVVVLLLIIAEKFLGNMGLIYGSLKNFTNVAAGILTPFIYGFLTAYLINPAVRRIEKFLSLAPGVRGLRIKIRRAMAILATFMMIGLAVYFSVKYITPEIIKSFRNFNETIKHYISLLNDSTNIELTNESIGLFLNGARDSLDEFFGGVNATFGTEYSSAEVVAFFSDALNRLISSLPAIIGQIFSGALSFAGSLFNVFIGLFVAFYMLLEKENHARNASKLVYACFKRNRAETLVASFRKSNRVFERFIVGKTLDSFIVGLLFFITALVLKLPYALLLSLIVGVTNMIPFFGPFIGAVPVILMVFLNDLSVISPDGGINAYKTLFAALAILVIQQIDGNIIGPKILGDSTGLTPLEVIFSIMVGGALFGVLGMFFGVPVFAVAKILVGTLVDRKLRERLEAGEAGAPETGAGVET